MTSVVKGVESNNDEFMVSSHCHTRHFLVGPSYRISQGGGLPDADDVSERQILSCAWEGEKKNQNGITTLGDSIFLGKDSYWEKAFIY